MIIKSSKDFPMKRVAVLPFPGLENCFVCMSGRMKRRKKVGEKWYKDHEENTQNYENYEGYTTPHISFIYVGNNKAVEWDGAYGPITVWEKCEVDYNNGYDKAQPHWVFPFAHGQGNWSQTAVDKARLPEKFNEGDYEGIFNELKEWA